VILFLRSYTISCSNYFVATMPSNRSAVILWTFPLSPTPAIRKGNVEAVFVLVTLGLPLWIVHWALISILFIPVFFHTECHHR
jgi:hypothetical protein